MQRIFIDAFKSAYIPINNARREVKQPWWREGHKFAYLTMKNSIFARFAREFVIFVYFSAVLA